MSLILIFLLLAFFHLPQKSGFGNEINFWDHSRHLRPLKYRIPPEKVKEIQISDRYNTHTQLISPAKAGEFFIANYT